MATIFTRIVQGEIPCFKVAENEEFFAFLDIKPKAQGHTLVIPKQEIDYFFDLDSDYMARMMHFTQQVASAIKTAFPCQKVGMAVLGLEVNHAHIHLIPLITEQDFYRKESIQLSTEEMAETARAIAAAMG